jgi:hypothetical protein
MDKDSKTTRVKVSDLHALVDKDPEQAIKAGLVSSFAGDNKDTDDFPSNLTPNRSSRIETQHMLSLHTDLEAAALIMIAICLSPRDTSSVDISFKTHVQNMPSQVVGAFTRLVEDAIKETVNLEKLFEKVLHEELIGDGAVVKLVLSESILDGLINSGLSISTEKVVEKLLNAKDRVLTKPSDEFILSDLVTITDNTNILRIPEVKDAMARDVMDPNSVVQMSTEETNKVIQFLDESMEKRESITKPLLLDVHPCACKVIYYPGDPSRHAAYVILLDKDGYPITDVSNSENNVENASLKDLNIDRNSIRHISKRGLISATRVERKANDASLFKSYLRQQLMSRINDEYFSIPDGVDMDAILTAVLARSLKKEKTTMLVLPPSMVCYFANTYGPDGQGVNKIHNLQVLASIRSMLMYSAFGHVVRNQARNTTVAVEVDPVVSDLPKFQKTIRRLIANMNASELPNGLLNPRDLAKWQQEVGTKFEFTGHEGLLNTKIDFRHEEGNRPVEIDNTLMEHIRKLMLLSIGPSADMVDNGFDSRHASTADAKRSLLVKKGQRLMGPLLEQASHLVGLILKSHGGFMRQLRKTYETMPAIKQMYQSSELKDLISLESYISTVINKLIGGTRVSMPPMGQSTKLSDITAEVEELGRYLEMVLPAFISEDMLDSSLLGDVGTDTRAFIDIYKAHFIRQYIADNMSIVDLDSISQTDSVGNPHLDIGEELENHIKGLMKSLGTLKKTMKKAGEKYDKTGSGEPEPEDTPPSEDTDTEDTTPPDEEDPFA